MIYLFDKDGQLIKLIKKSAIKSIEERQTLTDTRYISERLSVELKALSDELLARVEYVAVPTKANPHLFALYFLATHENEDDMTMLKGAQVGIEELRKVIVEDKKPRNKTARPVIEELLSGTNWSARYVAETASLNTNLYYVSVFEALQKVCEVWDLEMQFFVEVSDNRIAARYIDFKRKIGKKVGTRLVYGTNALKLVQQVERTKLITAAIGRGKGEEVSSAEENESGQAGYGRKIDFSDIVWTKGKNPVDKPKGQKYVEIKEATARYGIKRPDGMYPKIDIVEIETDDREELLRRTYEELLKLSRPQATFKADAAYLKNAAIGDTIRVVRKDWQLDYETRIIEIAWDRLSDKATSITVGDQLNVSESKKTLQSLSALDDTISETVGQAQTKLLDHLISADGFNTNWYRASEPPLGKTKIGDIWYKPDPEHEGEKIMLIWDGENWVEVVRTVGAKAITEKIEALESESARYEQEFMQGLQDATTQAEVNAQAMREQLETQIADETQAIKDKQAQFEAGMSQDRTKLADLTQKVGTLSSQQTADKQSLSREIASAKSSVASVASDLATAKTSLNNAVAQANTKATSLEQSLTQTRQTLEQQGRDLVSQASAQAELRTLTTEVKRFADGTKTEVTELSKTLNQNGKDIASVSARTKTVEDTLAGTATKITELTKQGEATSRKTAELTSGLESTNAKFSSIWTGARNLLTDTEKLTNYDPLPYPRNNYLGKAIKRVTRRASDTSYADGLQMRVADTLVNPKEMILSFYVFANRPVRISCFMYNPNGNKSVETSDGYKVASAPDGKAIISVNSTWQRVWVKWTYQVGYVAKPWVIIGRIDEAVSEDTYVNIVAPALYHGHHTREWAPSDLDVSEKIAEYEQSAERNYASLQSSLTTLSGTVTQNKTSIEQTAGGLKSRIESLESYKDAEGNRATQYFELAKAETAKQLSAERTQVSQDYVAKSSYTEDVSGLKTRLTATEKVASTATTKADNAQSSADKAKQLAEAVTTKEANYEQTVDRKLAELTQSTQTLDGKIATANTKVELTTDGLQQLSTKVTNQEGLITSHTADIKRLNSEVSSKVSQTSYDTLTGRVTSAESLIQQQAIAINQRLTATQVEAAIAGHNFATATTLENKITETVSGYTREISRVKGLIPTETTGNLLLASNQLYTNTGSMTYEIAETLVRRQTYTITSHFWKGEGSQGHTGTIKGADGNVIIKNANGTDQYFILAYNPKVDSWMVTITPTVNIPKGSRLQLFSHPANSKGNVSFVTMVKGIVPLSVWQPHWSEQATVTALNTVKSTADEHTRTLTSLQNDTLKKAEVSITSDKIVLGVGKEVNGRTFSTMIAQNSQYVDIIAEKLRVSGSMIVDGTITSKDLAVGSVTAAQIVANSVTADKIATNAVTADKLLADQALFNKLKANQAYLKTLFTTDAFAQTVKTIDLVADKITTGTLNGANVNLINLNASNITSGRLSANMISGGVLSSSNGSVYFDLNNSKLDFNRNATIEFKSASNAIFRKRNVHTAFLHFQDTTLGGVESVYASLGVTRGNHGINSASSGRFAGIRIFSTSTTADPNGSQDALHEAKADQIELYGDKIILTHGFGGNAITLRANQLDKSYDLLSWMQGVKKAIKSLSAIWSHANNVNWDFVNSNDLRRAVYNELNSFGWGNGL